MLSGDGFVDKRWLQDLDCETRITLTIFNSTLSNTNRAIRWFVSYRSVWEQPPNNALTTEFYDATRNFIRQKREKCPSTSIVNIFSDDFKDHSSLSRLQLKLN